MSLDFFVTYVLDPYTTRLPRPAGSLRFSPESALAYAPSWREGEDPPSLAGPLRASPDSGCDARRGRRGEG
jgi:hypothetical protein